jgi:hypothetical protein
MSRTWSIVIKESYRHILSDESAEYVDDRPEQGFDRRGDGNDAVRLDARDHAIQVNAAVVQPANVLQRRMVGLCAREGPNEQRVASILAHCIAQVLGHAQARSLQRSADQLWFSLLPMSFPTGQQASSDLQ